ncbi:MAG: hypothetical protein AUJ92_08235 [Armatimonadetes bacterium CG2_30_59_28]|nr:hypothetical protein [Armatimonadota bacterium]OIO95270.1 MAG: hypothetical protein AUJ92_08235 [Armatimonadetes bacterium CG2_30_59_28]PIU61702.1 MAG: hypothetical protein COS85_20435 [Armatimonadetes bacterium CG07_land_8_20_14_0_80_59_28]PIX44698.1 MAG: hypothetical protein COZ56_03960 [Armatimonadetes bacterium CG_4_8_14_3_um_filter_58_9]PJB70177.1 MAG: hypothetical protein CO095_09230 [Armatimonadetes bacterium CG_4_9_14_3_um_filter_58_7]
MNFRWNQWNTQHIAEHGVEPEDAEAAVLDASAPYSRYRGDGKWLVWGRGTDGKPLQVVFVFDEEGAIFVIHARPLTPREEQRFRRNRK